MAYKFNVFTGIFDIVNSALSSTNYLGSDLSGSDGEQNRTLTASATMIIVDNMTLQLTKDYTITGGVITFLNQMWDDMTITLWN